MSSAAIIEDSPPHADPVEIINFGCRLNIAEGAAVRARLAEAGQRHPITIINSCAVTANATRDARTAARKARQQRPDAHIIVTGCAAQIEPQRFAAMAEVDRVVGNGEKLDDAPYRFDDAAAPRVQVRDIARLARSAPQLMPAFTAHARAFLEVQNGCDHSCTFCIIPMGRGPSRSIAPQDIIASARALVEAGVQEIVLTGVDLTSYESEGVTLPVMIEQLLTALPALKRLRLGSIDVAEIDDHLFALITGHERMLPHLHLSLQHGDDLMLKRMKRRHSRAQAIAMAARIRAARPEMALGADLIAGFPTEDERAFTQSLTLIAECDIVHPHIFPYSVREGTAAARMPQVPRAVVKERAAGLREAAAARRNDWLRSLIGQHMVMLTERDGQSGHADNFAPVRLDSVAAPNSIMPIVIEGLDGATLIGKGAA